MRGAIEQVPTEDRYWSKVDRRGLDECWPWVASINPKTGYGVFHPGRRSGLPLTMNACIHGHEYTPENTYQPPNGGAIRCRRCASIREGKRGPRG